jgi:uncharacterized protein (DUF2147 family)
MSVLMRSLLLAALAVASAVVPTVLRAQPSPAGLWHTIDDATGKPRAEIRIEVAGNRLTGIVVRSLVPGEEGDQPCVRCPGARKNQPMIGMAILTGLARDKANPLLWNGGEVLDPDNGKIYKAKVDLAPDGQTLKMRGYIGIAMMGRTQQWRRVP